MDYSLCWSLGDTEPDFKELRVSMERKINTG